MYLERLMELFQADATLTGAVDLLLAEAPRSDIELNGPTQTILCLYDKVTIENRFLCVWRDVQKTDVVITIEVLSSNGNTDAYCNAIISYLINKMSIITTLSDTGWVVHVNSTIGDVAPDRPGRWKGTITLNCVLFEDT